MTTLPKTEVDIDRNKLIKILLSNKIENKYKEKFYKYLKDIEYKIKKNQMTELKLLNDLATNELLGLYKIIFDKEYIGSGILKPTEKQINKKYFI